METPGISGIVGASRIGYRYDLDTQSLLRLERGCHMPRHRSPTYQLERIPTDVWRRAKARAALEGQTIRGILLTRLREYAEDYLAPTVQQSTPISAVGPSAPLPSLTIPGTSMIPIDPELGF
jgi:hypothetical protein